MMYNWTPDIIRFMADASRLSDYFDVLAKKIFDEVGPKTNVCDAGCGLGQLAIALSKYYPRVTGIDINQAATDFFAKTISDNRIENVNVINADITKYIPQQKYDLMVFNYFGDMEQILKAKALSSYGTTIIIKRDCNKQDALSVLKDRNLCFKELEFNHDLGQPFKTMEDARLFCEIYNKGINKLDISKTDDKDFPFYMKHIKKSSILII